MKECLSLRISRRIVEFREREAEIERDRSQNPGKFAKELDRRLHDSLAAAKRELYSFLSSDPLIKGHLLKALRAMERQSPMPFVTVPLKPSRSCPDPGVAFEYRRSLDEAGEQGFAQRFTIVVGASRGPEFIVGSVRDPRETIEQLDVLLDTEPLAMALLEAFGPIEGA